MTYKINIYPGFSSDLIEVVIINGDITHTYEVATIDDAMGFVESHKQTALTGE